MAATTLLRIKSNSTKSISHILMDRTEYIEDDKKTNCKEFVSAFKCLPESAHLDFVASKALYEKVNGYKTKKKDDVLAYHIRQAFSPDDKISPEQAHEIGRKLADEFTKGKHEYVIATHIDKKHIHNHIIFNSTTIDCNRKFNNFYKSSSELMKISDRLCRENNLSVIVSNNEKGKHYKEWQEDKKGESWKSKLKRNIDKCIECSSDFDEFKNAMQDHGYEIKEGKYIAFRAKGQERFTRAKTLGEDYTQERITARIEKRSINKSKCVDLRSVRRFPFTIDKQLLYAKRKQRISDVKLLANTLMIVRNENINSWKDFVRRIDDLKIQSVAAKEDIKKLNNEIDKYRGVAKYLATSNKNKEVYQKYKKCNAFNKKQFYNKFEGDILSYEHALERLKQLNVKTDTPLEKIVSLVDEYKLQVNDLSDTFNAIEKRIKMLRNSIEVINKIRDKGLDIKVEQKSREENL